MVRSWENMLLAATAEGLGTVFHIPVGDEAEKIKEIVNAPEDYEFTCLLTMAIPPQMPSCPSRRKSISRREYTSMYGKLYFLKI